MIMEKKQSTSGNIFYETKHKILLPQHLMSPLGKTVTSVNAHSKKAAQISNSTAWETMH